ncbi:MAG: DNA-directed RNA polymerase subunit L [Nanoarchaeota archaeon]|nr:DNA-directed RNA polymerase subunit L [Nanoarchaeota archaeon]
MELNVLEETKTKLVVEVKGEDSTLMNVLRKELYNDKDVKAAAYSIKHPSIGVPALIVETTGKSPRDAITDALKRLKKNLADLDKKIAKEL